MKGDFYAYKDGGDFKFSIAVEDLGFCKGVACRTSFKATPSRQRSYVRVRTRNPCHPCPVSVIVKGTKV